MSGPKPRRIGGFEVEDELGQGGMGVVWLARQPSLERRVVLKALRRGHAEEPDLEERFLCEARAAAAVHHQNVVAVYDYFSWRGERYIAQEYVDGENLATVLDRVGRFEPRIAALIALELVRGLEEIHARGIVHRDLKPSNILLGRDGAVKIADFGIARSDRRPALTRTGHAIGTPRYMSPEQLLGECAEPRSDLFSLGVVLYEMLSGRLQEDAEDVAEDGEPVAAGPSLQAGRPPRLRRLAPQTPRWLARRIEACLRPRLAKRPASATVLRRALDRGLGRPAAADSRRVIAGWLRARRVFPVPDSGTVKLPVVTERVPRAVPAWRWAALVAAACALLITSLVIRDPAGAREVADRVRARAEQLIERMTEPAEPSPSPAD